MTIWELDTPSLLIDREILMDNLQRMQAYADRSGVRLRPHTKTHKMPWIAHQQMKLGAAGIAVAKVGEAEVMADHGLGPILIANEIVGRPKLERLRQLSARADVTFGVDTPCQVEAAEAVFAGGPAKAQVAVEIEVGENRSGVIEEGQFLELLETIRACPHVRFRGIFSHDGHTYHARDVEDLRRLTLEAQRRTLRFAELAREAGMEPEMVSVGSTPPLVREMELLPGITEIRPGTYSLMDVSQGNAMGTLEHCAATVLATVISRPTAERVILDVGAKGLTMQERTDGICESGGKGRLLGEPDVTVASVFDEHAILHNAAFRERCRVGDKVRILPVHICPVCNLYDRAYLISGETVVDCLEIAGRGKLL